MDFSQLPLDAWPCHPYAYFSRTGWWCLDKGCSRAGQTPSPKVPSFGQWGCWDGRGMSPTFPDSSQQGREQSLPTGSAGASGGERRADSFCQAWLAIPFLSLLWAVVPGISCPTCSSRKQRWEKRKRTSWFCVAVTPISQAWSMRTWHSHFQFPSHAVNWEQPQCSLLQIQLPGLQRQTSDHKLILSGASATEFRNSPLANPAGLFLLS